MGVDEQIRVMIQQCTNPCCLSHVLERGWKTWSSTPRRWRTRSGSGNQVKNILIPKTVWVATDPNSTEGAYMEVACDALRAPK